jgi:signal transduction histidine kinase
VVGRPARTRVPLYAGVAELALGGGFTALAWLVHGFDVAYGAEGMHIAVEAIQATVSLVVGGFAWARFTRSRRLADLAAALAFGLVMAVESAFLLALATLLNFERLRPFSVWSSSGTTVLSALLLVVAAGAGERRVARRRMTAMLAGAVVLALGLVAGLALAFEQQLPLAIDPALSPVARGRAAFTGDVAVLALQAATGVLLIVAGAKALLSPRREPGVLLGWLGPALVAGGLAAANYALFPSLYSYWVYTGDILRLAFCALLACGIVAELRASARRAIDAAVLEERRRLARDLHDGVAQELAFIAAEIVDISPELHPSLPWIRSAVERGLYESRRAIAALTMPLDHPLASAIAATAEDITARAGTTLRLELDETVEVSAEEHEAILRVVREAATNAVRHGRATTVCVTLEDLGCGLIRLRVADDGAGVDIGTPVGGFGLTSMRERIQATGGELRLESSPGAGTAIEAWWVHEAKARGGRSSTKV